MQTHDIQIGSPLEPQAAVDPLINELLERNQLKMGNLVYPSWFSDFLKKYFQEWHGQAGDTDKIMSHLTAHANDPDFLACLKHFQREYIYQNLASVRLVQTTSYFYGSVKYQTYIPEFEILRESVEKEVLTQEEASSASLLSAAFRFNKFAKKHPYLATAIAISVVATIGAVTAFFLPTPGGGPTDNEENAFSDQNTTETTEEAPKTEDPINDHLVTYKAQQAPSIPEELIDYEYVTLFHQQHAVNDEKENKLADMPIIKTELPKSKPPHQRKRGVQQNPYPFIPFGPIFNISDLNGTNGFKVSPLGTASAVHSAGDFNGDNIKDIAFVGNSKINILFGANNYTAFFNLSFIDGTNGFSLIGGNSAFGQTVSSLKDFNGDNINDLLIGDFNGIGAIILFGSRTPFNKTFNISQLDGSKGFSMNMTYSGSSAGDINGDGLTDAVLGCNFGGTNNLAIILYGSANPLAFTNSTFDLKKINGSNGFMIYDDTQLNYTFNDVSAGGDINGDNISDVILSKPYSGSSSNGDVVLLFGNRNGFNTIIYLSTLNGTNGFKIGGLPNSYTGTFVNPLGDINNDGYDDFVIGTRMINLTTYSSINYVFYGNSTFKPFYNVSEIDGTNGFILEVPNTYNPVYITGAGDVNDDKISDLLIAVGGIDQERRGIILNGNDKGFGKTVKLEDLNSTHGFTVPFTGRQTLPVAAAQDINNDSVDDIILSNYVIFGSKNASPAPAPTPSLLSPCPPLNPLKILKNEISLPRGGEIFLSPASLSTGCSNSTTPNEDTLFTLSNIKNVGIEVQQKNGSWIRTFSFFGRDQIGKVKLKHDNSTNPPEFDFNNTDGETTLTGKGNILFSLMPNDIQVSVQELQVVDGKIILDPQLFQVNSTFTRADDLQITPLDLNTLNGYYSTTRDPSTPITTFSYYDYVQGLIKYNQNGTQPPDSLTFQFSDGSDAVVVKLNLAFAGTEPNNDRFNNIIIGTTVSILSVSIVSALIYWGCKFKKESAERANGEAAVVRNIYEKEDQYKKNNDAILGVNKYFVKQTNPLLVESYAGNDLHQGQPPVQQNDSTGNLSKSFGKGYSGDHGSSNPLADEEEEHSYQLMMV